MRQHILNFAARAFILTAIFAPFLMMAGLVTAPREPAGVLAAHTQCLHGAGFCKSVKF